MLNLIFTLLFNGGIVTKVAMALLLAALIASIGSCTSNKMQLSSANKQVTSLQKDVGQLNLNNAILKKNQETLTNANQTNLQTIEGLVKERKDAQAAIDTLAKQKQIERKRADTANKRIEELLKNPANNGKVAPVLGETLKEYNK